MLIPHVFVPSGEGIDPLLPPPPAADASGGVPAPAPAPAPAPTPAPTPTLQFIDKVSVLGPVIVEVESGQSDEHVKEIMGKVIAKTNANNLRPCYLEGLDMDQDVLATALLDAGLHGVFFKLPTLGADTDLMIELSVFKRVLQNFPRARVGVVATISTGLAATVAMDGGKQLHDYLINIVSANRGAAVHFYFQFQQEPLPTLAHAQHHAQQQQQQYSVQQRALDQVVDTCKALVEKTTSAHDNIQVYVGLPRECHGSSKTATKVATAASDNTIHAVFKARPLTRSSSSSGGGGMMGAVDSSSADEGIDVLSAFIACARSDRPDGLYTTVVCDQHGVCLGLVYSNDVSICAAVFEKKGIYWSRSRGGLWRKGDSSGMHQELLSIDLDCDGDALRFTVIQHGTPASFCHLMTRTCWGDVHGFQHLQSILQARLVSAPPGSYTKRLFTDEDLLMKKLVEEAQELAEAKTHDEVAGEAADLMYFLMTRCVAAGVSLKDIENKLDYRSLKVTRRPGNAKDYRTEVAAALLPQSAKLQAAVAAAAPPAPAPAPAPVAAAAPKP